MKKLFAVLVVVLLVFTSAQLRAQQKPIFSQYLFNGLVLNPAYAGNHVQLSATAIYRDQWVNFEGAPSTTSFSMHSSFLKSKMGLGLIVNKDEIGVHDDFSVYGSYAYRIKMVNGVLALGLQAGFNYLRSDFSQLNLRNPGDVFFENNSKFNPNFGTGVYYSNEKLFAGFSIPFLINNDIINDLEGLISEAREARNYYLTGGIILPLNRQETVKFEPSVLMRVQEGAPVNLDLNASIILHDLVSFGASYRNGDALVTLFDVKISESFHFGYSYDWTLSDIQDFSRGTHEFMINYRTRIRGVHKNVECPSFYSH
ncbi:MAG: type IX secretion system membrane protein PorP/SprF [Bacteroidota bacterium]